MSRALPQQADLVTVTKWMVHLVYDYVKGRVDKDEIEHRVFVYLDKFSAKERMYAANRMHEGLKMLSEALLAINSAWAKYLKR
jgi:hypothetical protein